MDASIFTLRSQPDQRTENILVETNEFSDTGVIKIKVHEAFLDDANDSAEYWILLDITGTPPPCYSEFNLTAEPV